MQILLLIKKAKCLPEQKVSVIMSVMNFKLRKNRFICGSVFLLLGFFLLHRILAQTGGAEFSHRQVRLALEAYFVDHNAYPPWEYKDYGKKKLVATFKNTILTTPVHYLTQMPVDIFSPDGNHWYSYYSVTAKKEGEKHGWILISAGPDRDYDCNAPKVYDPNTTSTLQILIKLEYDATNGTISNGDLISCSEWRF